MNQKQIAKFASVQKKIEQAVGVVIIFAVILIHVKDSNEAYSAILEAHRVNEWTDHVRAGELEVQAAKRAQLSKKEAMAKLEALNIRKKNEDALASLNEYERALIQKESSFRTTAKNPNSTAFGLFQMIHSNRVKYAKLAGVDNPDTTEAWEQIAMGRMYIEHRYDNAKIALAFWNINRWY